MSCTSGRVPGLLERGHRREHRPSVAAGQRAAAQDVQARPRLGADRAAAARAGASPSGSAAPSAAACSGSGDGAITPQAAGGRRRVPHPAAAARCAPARRPSSNSSANSRGHAAAEVHLVGQRHAEPPAQLGDAAAHPHQLVERQQLLLVLEVIALALPLQVDAVRRVERTQHQSVHAQLRAELDERIHLVDVGAHRHEHEVDERQASAARPWPRPVAGRCPAAAGSVVAQACVGLRAWRRRARCRGGRGGRAACGCWCRSGSGRWSSARAACRARRRHRAADRRPSS